MKRPAQSRIKNLEGRVKNKKCNSFFKSLIRFYAIVPVLLICLFGYLLIPIRAEAASGINKQINFQGKLVDNNGLNVADSTYTVVFSLYTTSSGGSAAWTESDSVSTLNGVFQVALGATTAFPGNVDFNSDTWYLGIKVGSDAEMTPRVRFSAVPYAFNAAALDGIVATNSATQFTITGGTDALIDLTVNGSLTLGSTIKPTATGALTVQSNGAQGLTLDTGGAAALNIGATANSITFGATNNPTYAFNGTGAFTVAGGGNNNITFGSGNGTGTVVIQPNAGGKAALIINDQGLGDIFTASAAGVTKFVIQNNGHVGIGTASPFARLHVSGGNTSGNAAFIVDQIGAATNDIFSASASGGTKFTVSNAGTVTIASGQSYTGIGAVTVSSGGAAGLTLDSASGTIALATGDVFQISRAGDPTAANGMIYYDSTAGKFKIVENVSGTPTVKTLCNTTDAGCGAGGATSLQNAYNTGNTISLSNNNLIFGNSPTGVGNVVINPTAGGAAALVINKTVSTGDIFTASASGSTKFTVSNSGALTVVGGTGGDITTSGGTGLTGNALTITTGVGTAIAGSITIQPGNNLDVGGGAGVTIDAGTAALGGTNGSISIGTVNANGVTIGRVGKTVTILGTCSGCGGSLQSAYNSGQTIDFTGVSGTAGLTIGTASGTGNILFQPNAGGKAALIINKQAGVGAIITASSSGTTRFLLTNSGTMVIGSGVTNANALSQSGLTIYQDGLGNSVLNVNQLGAGDIFTASASGVTKFQVTNTGKLVLGDSTNGLTFDPGAGPSFVGSGRPTKQIILSAEYAGAVLTASGSATITGNMTSDASPSAVTTTANNYENYYMWTATALGADQQYTVAVRVTLPKDFSDWATGNAITVDFNTPFTNSALNSLDVFIYKGGDTTGKPVAFSKSNVSATSKNWTQVAFTKTQLTSVAPTLTAAGQVAVFYLTFHSTNTVNYVQVGDITLNYLAGF